MYRLNKTESAVFFYIVGSLYFGRIRFPRLIRGRISCRCFYVKLVKLLPAHRYSVDIFHAMVLQECWDLTESRIPLKLVLGDMIIFCTFH